MILISRESLLFASKIKNVSSQTPVRYEDNWVQTGDSLQCLEMTDRSEFKVNLQDSVLESTDKSDINRKSSDISEKSDQTSDHNSNVERIIKELLLKDCASNQVDICSGGEQKRLSVGLELMAQNKPNLLCIDEPTSGLDSNAAEVVLKWKCYICLSSITLIIW